MFLLPVVEEAHDTTRAAAAPLVRRGSTPRFRGVRLMDDDDTANMLEGGGEGDAYLRRMCHSKCGNGRKDNKQRKWSLVSVCLG